MKKQVCLSELFDLGSINANGTVIRFVADARECQQVLDIIGIISLDRLEGEARIKPWHKTGFMIEGEVRASVVQECVVTLDPVTEEVVETFERTYIPEAEAEATREEPDEDVEVDFILEAEDPPEVLASPSINLLEIVAEHLALGLNPYPRKQGAEIDPVWQTDDNEEQQPKPFDVLKQLKP